VCHKALCKQCAKARDCDLSDSGQPHPAHATTLQLKTLCRCNKVVNGAAAAFGILKSELNILIPWDPAIQD